MINTKGFNTRPEHAGKGSGFVLGTVQLGLAYGAANISGLPSEAAAAKLIETALTAGVRSFDTARAYGHAEQRLGRTLGASTLQDVIITTKLDPLSSLTPQSPPTEACALALESLDASRRALQRERLDALLLHRAWHREAWGGAVWKELIAQKERGVIGRLGISAGTPEEALAALADPYIEQIQLPFNILDRRYADRGVIEAARRRSDVVIHVRSVLMQGLLGGSPDARWPMIDGIDPTRILESLRECAANYHRRGLVDLCVAYARSQDWVDGVVIGCETIEQLVDNVSLFEEPLLHAEALSEIKARFAALPEQFLEIPGWPAGRRFANGAICQ